MEGAQDTKLQGDKQWLVKVGYKKLGVGVGGKLSGKLFVKKEDDEGD